MTPKSNEWRTTTNITKRAMNEEKHHKNSNEWRTTTNITKTVMNEEQQPTSKKQQWMKNNITTTAMDEEQQPTSQKQQCMKNRNQHHKNLLEVLPSKVPLLGVFFCLQKLSTLSIKKMITEVLLTLHLYPILFLTCWRFRHLIKIMTELKTY